MNARQRTILNAIERGGHNTTSLAQLTGVPEASVRRAVQSLRRQGYNVSFADPRTGVYTYRTIKGAAYEPATTNTL